MKRVCARALIGSLLLILGCEGAFCAASLSDGFASGIEPNVWNVISNTTEYAIDDSQGDIRISKPVGGDYSLRSAGLKLRHTIRGDFDVQVDFRDASIDRFDGSPGNQVQLNLDMGPQLFVLVRSDEAGAGHNIHVWIDPPAGWVGAQPTAATSGRFRITRAGSLVTAYLDATPIYQGNYNTNDTTLSFILQNNGTRDATSVTFDNFAVTADEIVPVLSIAPFGPGQAQVSWTPDTGTNWLLQETSILLSANWTNAPSGSTNPVTVPMAGDTKFYRLFKP